MKKREIDLLEKQIEVSHMIIDPAELEKMVLYERDAEKILPGSPLTVLIG